MNSGESVFAEEWKEHIRQTSRQRLGISIFCPVLVGALSYLNRPWHELIFAVIAVGILAFLSEISIDLKGMRLMMAERRESEIGIDKY